MRLPVSIAIMLVIAACCCSAAAQSDDLSLGDIARSYRKTQNPPQKVIDNDNLPQVMDQGESKKWALQARKEPAKTAVQLINFQSPNVTCALSFNGRGADSLGNAPRPERLPDEEVARLDGPASIVGDTLEVSVLNATAWDVREITVGLTIVRKQFAASAAFLIAPAKLVPTVQDSPDRKQPDTTLVYHMHGTASPYSTAVFREVLDRPLASDEEWHWAILQAKGLPPAPSPAPEQASTTSAPGTAGTPTHDQPPPDSPKGSVVPVSATPSPKN